MWIGLFLVVLGVPLLELAVLIKLGQSIGLWPTILVLIATAVLGMAILHTQGLAAFRRAMEAISEGRPPVEPVVDGAMLMIAGTLLVVPGLITDAAGLVLLIPPVRRWLGAAWVRRMLAAGRVHATVVTSETGAGPTDDPTRPNRPRQAASAGPVIEGEFERIDEKPPRPRRDDKSD